MTSNGLGAGTSLCAAVEHAALELYERDAFLHSWTMLKPKLRVQVADSGGIVEHLAGRGAETEVYLLCDAPVFVAAAVARGDGERWPAQTPGLGAARDEASAVDKAILELGQTAPYLARVWRGREVALPESAREIGSLQEQALYYCDAAHDAEFAAWLGTPDERPTTGSGGGRIAVVDITPPELLDGAYRVVRGLGRGLRNVAVGHGFERLTRDVVRNKAVCPIC